MIKLRRIFTILAALVAVGSTTGCTDVIEPGYVGLVVDMYGKNRGVQDLPIQTGRVWFNPWTHDVFKFPTFVQNATWDHEGDNGDESVTFNSVEGATINADIALAYSFDAAHVPALFVEFRQPVEVITQTYMRNKVRSAFSAVASTFRADEIYGARKQEFLAQVKERLNNELGPKGFKFDMVDFIGQPRLPQNIQAAINAGIEATQQAIRAENALRTTQAEAAQRVAEAEGQADAQITRARGEAEANRIIDESLSPDLLEARRIAKWDGKLPQVTGQSTPFIDLRQ